MHILWVKVGGLWPLNMGGRLRSFHTIAELARRHRVTVLTTHGPGEEPDALAAQLPGCESVESFFHRAGKVGSASFVRALARSWLSPLPVDLWKWRVPALREAVSRALARRDVDLCVADFLAAAPSVPMGGPVPTVLFTHNVEHMIWKRLRDVEPNPLRRAALELEWRKMRRYEAWACARADLTLAVSRADREVLSALAPAARVVDTPTGVDVRHFAPLGAPERPDSLVFSGAMDWYPNEDAMLHFAGEMLPEIRRHVPRVSVTVVGRNPSERLRAASTAAGIEVTGTVDDVRPHIAQGAVYVVPLRVGGGTRLKIFEALAMGKAVVSTRVGAEGLPIVPGEHFLQADEPGDFAAAVVALLRDPARRAALGAAGRRLVEARYSWAEAARDFEASIAGARRREWPGSTLARNGQGRS